MGNCTTQNSLNSQRNHYRYEGFLKVPKLTNLNDWHRIIQFEKTKQIVTCFEAKNFRGIDDICKSLQNKNLPSKKQKRMIKNGPITLKLSNDLFRYQNHQHTFSINANDPNLTKTLDKVQNCVYHKILKSPYDSLVQRYKNTDQKWTDQAFPPDNTSLGDLKKQKQPQMIKWKRISQIIPNAKFIQNKIEPADILQGALGDCYFLAALAALAELPWRITRLFPSKEINKNGIYMARIYHRGICQQVVVDDYFPVNERNQLKFAQPHNQIQIWVMVLEKCWAKLYNSYGATIGGLPAQPLHDLSGAPTYTYFVDEFVGQQNELWQKILKKFNQGALLACGTRNVDIKSGVAPGHAYTMLGVFNKPCPIVKLRNPWGQYSWKGKASQKDVAFWSSVSQEDKSKLGYIADESDDGVFFMLYPDFLQYYNIIDVCMIDDNANYFYESSVFSWKHANVFRLQVCDTNNASLTLSLSQESIRSKSLKQDKKSYYYATIIVAKVTNNVSADKNSSPYTYQYIGSEGDNHFADLHLKLDKLQIGEYVVYCKYNLPKNLGIEATLAVYTARKAVLSKAKQEQYPMMLKMTMMSHAKSKPRKTTNAEYGWQCDHLFKRGGYGYIAFGVHAQSLKYLELSFNEDDFIQMRMRLKKPYKNNGKCNVKLSKGQEQIIVFRIIANQIPSGLLVPKYQIRPF